MAPEILLPSTGESFEFDGVAEIRGLALGSNAWGCFIWAVVGAIFCYKILRVFSRAYCLTTMTKSSHYSEEYYRHSRPIIWTIDCPFDCSTNHTVSQPSGQSFERMNV